jgi:hypothetical protein
MLECRGKLFEKKLLFKIDAVTGNMSSFKVEKISGEK